MKKIPMILLLIVPYAVLIICYQLNLDMTVGVGLYGALILFNMIYAFRMPGLGFDGKQILRWNLLLKLGNIPLVNLIRVSTLVLMMIGGERMKDTSAAMVWIALLVLFWCGFRQPCLVSAVFAGAANTEPCPRPV